MSSCVVLIDSIYAILNTIQFFIQNVFISLFMKLTHIQVFVKQCMKLE